MANWNRDTGRVDPVPPGHGEPNETQQGGEHYCWCGRPLYVRTELVGARKDVPRSRIVCHEHGYARYVVQQVFPDGNPEIVYRSTSLAWAHEHANSLRRQYAQAGMSKTSFVGVTDEDDPERGWLQEEE